MPDTRRRDHVGLDGLMPAGRDPAGIDQAAGRTSGRQDVTWSARCGSFQPGLGKWHVYPSG